MEINRAPTPSPPPPPYWTQPSFSSSGMPRHRRSSSPVLSAPVLIVLIPIATFVFLFFAVPPVLSFTSYIFRPIAVKKGWDLLNIFLVLFAILCGVFARRNDDESDNGDGDGDGNGRHGVGSDDVVRNADRIRGVEAPETDSVTPQRWFGYSENDRRSEKVYGSGDRTPASSSLRRLRRSSSSYPDLRQESLWEDRDDDQRFQFRFFDDFEINKYRETTSFNRPSREPSAPTETHRSQAGDREAKVIPVDKFELRAPAPETPPPPPPPPPPVERHKPRRAYRAVERKEKKVEKREEIVTDDDDVGDRHFTKVIRSPPPTPPPPPPRPPPSPARIRPEQKKLERRKSNVKREIATALASLYNQRKRKKKQKTIAASHSPDSSAEPQSRFPPPSPPPPPPPLPPPPSSVFHNLFKKGTSKSKRIHSVPPPPPPPPPPKHKSRTTPPPAPPTPPPPPASERSRRTSSTSGGKPPLPARPIAYHEESNASSGCQSPLIPIPPPPPPPPFKMPEMRFFLQGDYVRIRSAQSSRCGSPELDDSDSSSTKGASGTVNAMDGGDGTGRAGGTVSCPSPDVNLKADTFIARLYDGWRLEKINSLKEKKKM